MKTCRNCAGYQYDWCPSSHQYDDEEIKEYTDGDIQDVCRYFKDYKRFIELPCSVGDTVYTVVYQKVFEAEVVCIRPFVLKNYVEFRGNAIITFEDPFYNDKRTMEQELFVVFGKDTFLIREEAEKKLEEMKNGQI